MPVFVKKTAGRYSFHSVFKLTLIIVLLINTMKDMLEICYDYKRGKHKKGK